VDARLAEPFKKFLPWWMLLNCGAEMQPGLKASLAGRENVFVTHPLDAATACRMITTVNVPRGQTTSLDLVVGHHAEGRWRLVVRGNGKELLSRLLGDAPASRPAALRPASRPASQPATRAASGPASRPAPPPPPEVKWVELHVDLTAFAGGEVRLELLNCVEGAYPNPAAYWGQVRVNSR
jgi:hypothetical protein